MSKYKRIIGLVLGVLVAIIIYNSHFAGLSVEGQKCLAISLGGVICWAAGVAQPGYVSLLMLVSYVLTNTAPANVVFSLWQTHLVYLVIAGFLIASAVESSGLGKRIAYTFILKFVHSFTSVIVSCYVLGLFLSFLIPHPFPRCFLIMSVMGFIIKAADLPREDVAIIGLAVFGGSTANSMVLLTGDSTLNILAASFGGQMLSWLDWAKYMAVPGLIAHVLMCGLQLKLFKPSKPFNLDKEVIRQQLMELGSLTTIEKKTLFWIVLGVALWAADSIHHIVPGWIGALVVCGLAMPVIGDVLKPKNWDTVPIGTLLFLTAAMAIGTVGAHTGMNQWIASVALPSYVPTNPFVFALVVTTIAICIHMVMGSLMAVLGITAPAIIAYAATAGWNPLFCSLLVYTAICIHWVLPMHSLNILVGTGEEGGQYKDSEVIKFGLAQTVVVYFIILAVEIPWWKFVGLI
ncbi:MAG: family permease [Firmicutes bacterium]|nr:family permease [Bacillota bacterium]